MRVVLTIAGSDSSAGAGIQADLKTFQRCGVYGVCAVTAVTAQNSSRVWNVYPLPPRAIQAQMEAVITETGVDAVKTGMLWSEEVVKTVRRTIVKHQLHPLVVDPIILSHDGKRLLRRGAEKALIEQLLPLADVVTPNIHEAERLSNLKIRNQGDIFESARRIVGRGPRAVLITGGHRGRRATDWLYDGRDLLSFTSPRVKRASLHGSGCILSAAIAAGLAKGQSLVVAVRNGKAYVTGEMRRPWRPGRGEALALHRWAV